jgi:pimeloyl-ACP methyl ester carboxylesterase
MQQLTMWQAGRHRSPGSPRFCIKAFSETGLTEDLSKIDIPTLVLHDDADQIVPIGASAMLSSKLIKYATLKVYEGAPHGMCTTFKDRVNADVRLSSIMRMTVGAAGPTARNFSSLYLASNSSLVGSTPCRWSRWD